MNELKYSVPVKKKLVCHQCENDTLKVYLVEGGIFLICSKCAWSWGVPIGKKVEK